MGMTIENSIETLTSILDEATESEDSVCYVTSADAEALKLARDTMRKYQKIEQIVNAELEEYHPLDRNIYRLALIRKVIEDGNNTTNTGSN